MHKRREREACIRECWVYHHRNNWLSLDRMWREGLFSHWFSGNRTIGRTGNWCGVCWGTQRFNHSFGLKMFESAWSETEAQAEREANGWKDVDCAIVCDTCHQMINSHVESMLDSVPLQKGHWIEYAWKTTSREWTAASTIRMDAYAASLSLLSWRWRT